MDTREKILVAYQFRHACKEFDATKLISDIDFNTILETARLSPSSFGLEPWKFIVAQNPALREKIGQCSWGAQGQLPTASHFIVILARTASEMDGHSDYIQKRIMYDLQHLPEDVIALRTEKIENFQKNDFQMTTPRHIEDWAAHQAYIPLANMMTTAALLGIDSCPIEGFDQEKLTILLTREGLLEGGRFRPVLLGAFGFRKENPIREKTRRPREEVVQWVR